MFTALHGHVSPETALVVEDWPYGYTLRCKKRFWIETREGFGQRMVCQTTNPKVEGEKWNKPKAGQYAPITILFRDDSNGHVGTAGLSQYSSPAEVQVFNEKYPDACADNYRAKILKGIAQLQARMAGKL